MTENYFGSALRRRIIFIIIVGMVSVQSFQLVNMQLLESGKYEEKSKDNSIKTFPISAPRGIVFDRNIEILVGNKPSFTLQITPSEYNQSNSKLIESVLNVDSGYINKLFLRYKKFAKFKPITLMKGVDYKIISWLEENHVELSGITYIVETKRDYSFGINAAHVFGYTKEIDRKTLNRNKDKYSIGDNIGFGGIEKKYEEYLRGKKGEEYFVVNSRQRIVSRYDKGKSDIQAIKGNDLVLTLDYETQKISEELMRNYKGAVVALNPTNGEILSFVSAPQYDLSDFAGVTSIAVWDSLLNDKNKPLFNRGTISMYPPGSTYKMLVAMAAIEEGIIKPSYEVNCKGGLQLGNRFFKCTHFHGKVNLKEAIEESCNTYFYKLIRKVGIDNLSKYSKKFHLGEKTQIDLSPESEGLIPSIEYYDKVLGKGKLTDGYLLNLSIGQGEIITTPVQLAQYIALIANSGVTKVPHFAKGYIESSSNEFIPFEFDSVKAEISKKSFKLIQDAMKGVVNSEKGTASGIKLKDILISGKTGTAQNPHGEDHSIFVAYAPSENPEIAVAVIIENIGYGSTFAAPVAQKIIATYLNREKRKMDLFNFNTKVPN
ncbi:MAG: penicillin-binding protein 2 [Melioribacteraceae bacterium]|jgi:penicillin-binding protein 2|nr:penicillin-binding protein 2 [Melioribacteraceae bacterium]